MDQIAEDILSGPDYFYCERLHMRMRRSACITEHARQENMCSVNMCKGCRQYYANREYVGANDYSPVRGRVKAPPRLDIIEKVEARRRAASVEDKHVGAGLVSAREEDGMSNTEGNCIVEGCEKPVQNRGLCGLHYYRWQKGKDETIVPLPSRRGERKKAAPKIKIEETQGVAAPVPEIIDASVGAKDLSPVQAVMVDNSETYRAVAMAFISRIERRVIDAVVEGLKD